MVDALHDVGLTGARDGDRWNEEVRSAEVVGIMTSSRPNTYYDSSSSTFLPQYSPNQFNHQPNLNLNGQTNQSRQFVGIDIGEFSNNKNREYLSGRSDSVIIG
jgi:hypothetical protein